MRSLVRRAAAGCLALLGTLAVGTHTTAAQAAPPTPACFRAGSGPWSSAAPTTCGPPAITRSTPARSSRPPFEDELDRFFARCAAAGPRCGFGGTDPEDAFDTLLARLDGQPLTTGDPAHPRLSGDDVRQAALAAMYTPRLWRDFATALTAATDGRPSAMLDFLTERDGVRSYDQQFAVLAVDQRFPRGPVAGYARDSVHAYRMFPHFWWVNGLVNLDLALWPAEDVDAFRGRIHHPGRAAPVLVISNTHDPATPYAGARQLVADLGNARLLIQRADGHASLTSGNPCLVGPALAYLTDGVTLPPAGATCRDDTDPFAA